MKRAISFLAENLRKTYLFNWRTEYDFVDFLRANFALFVADRSEFVMFDQTHIVGFFQMGIDSHYCIIVCLDHFCFFKFEKFIVYFYKS